MMSKKRKTVPAFASETEERKFWETHDSGDYLDWSKAEGARLPNLKRRPSRTPCVCRWPFSSASRSRPTKGTGHTSR